MKRKRKIIVVTFLLLTFMVVGLVLARRRPIEKRIKSGERISLLLLNLKKKAEPESLKDALLVTYQPNTKRLSLVVIPSRTLISDKRKLKSLYRQSLKGDRPQKEGCLVVKESLENLLGLEIPFYIIFDEESFIKVVDLLGGIEVEFDQSPSTELPGWGGERLNGTRHQMVLGGKESLAYLEFEEPRFGEFGKFSRWQRFVRALIQRFSNSPPDVALMKELFKNFPLTNLRAIDIRALGQEAEDIREVEVAVSKIPGKTIYRDWVSYWQVDTVATAQLFRDLDRGLEEKEEIIRVEVLNGCGRDGIAFQLAQNLRREGLDVIHIGNAPNFKYSKTLILNRSGRKGVAGKIAALMGYGQPRDEIEKDAFVDVTVIIGRDYLKRG